MADNSILTVNFLKHISATKQHTQTCYISSIGFYLQEIDGRTPTAKNAIWFFDRLKEAGYSQSSINRHLAAVKSFFVANKIEWDSTLKSAFVSIYQQETPTISIEDVKLLIKSTCKNGISSDMVYLALSTVYGLRRVELARIVAEDVDKKNSTLFIKTAKGGVERKHSIPKEIDFVKDFPFEEQSETTMSVLFTKICLLGGYIKKPNEGWHSVRRSIVSEFYLNTNIPEAWIRLFFRWAPAGTSQRYFATGVNPLVADRKIFEKHPFLEFWKEK